MLCDRVLAGRLLRGDPVAWCERVLPAEHFEFRGGHREAQHGHCARRPLVDEDVRCCTLLSNEIDACLHVFTSASRLRTRFPSRIVRITRTA